MRPLFDQSAIPSLLYASSQAGEDGKTTDSGSHAHDRNQHAQWPQFEVSDENGHEAH
jgi:hypothetical protein